MTEVYSLIVLGTEVQNQGVNRATHSLKALGKDPSSLLSRFWQLAIILGLLCHHSNLCNCHHIDSPLYPSSHDTLCYLNFPCLIRTAVINPLRSHLHSLILTDCTYTIPNKVIFTGTRLEHRFFGADTILPTTQEKS